MDLKTSPLAPDRFPDMEPVKGVRLATGAAGIRQGQRTDVMLAVMDPGSAIAGVFTRSACASAPVDWCKAQIGRGSVRAIIVNSGNANAFTGQAGWDAAMRTANHGAQVVGCDAEDVYISSTGVIGEQLADDKIRAILGELAGRLDPSCWHDAARAIMTTDTFPKGATATARIGDKEVTLNGITKGSGMIAPDMATMLGYVFTDAVIPADILQPLLAEATAKSFNCITVDSDTSTSDTVLLCATGQAGNQMPASASDPALDDFKDKLESLCKDLAQQIVRDGEGASKFITIRVEGALSNESARIIALAIANSPLVKTAIAGQDANWGRIVMAVGKAGQPADRDKLDIDIGGVTVARAGRAVEGYDEAPVAEHMKGQEIQIRASIGLGNGIATVWTCDLTHGYIDINAHYRS